MKARMTVVPISLVFVLLATAGLSAQTFRGTILGTVTDPSGAVVAGAQVSVKNLGTGLERTTETSADGSYSLPELPIGTYTVTVTQSGFQTFVANDVPVTVASERGSRCRDEARAGVEHGGGLGGSTAAGGDHVERAWRRAHAK